MGRMLGYVRCDSCGDRSNWKPWVDIIRVSDAKVEYEMPVCENCFYSLPLIGIINIVKKDITDDNNFCRNYGFHPVYSDADQEQIMSAMEMMKSAYGRKECPCWIS